MTRDVLICRDITVGDDERQKLGPLTLSLQAGARVAVLGVNGAGKTRLIKAIMGFEPITRGDIAFAGKPINGWPVHARARAGIGLVPAGRRLFPAMTVDETLDVAAEGSAAARALESERIYALFPRLAERRDGLAWSLSGGEQQMLAIARALVRRPKLILFDEPFLGLGPAVVEDIAAAIDRISEEGVAMLITDQTPARAARVSDHAVVLVRGNPVAQLAQHQIAADDVMELMLGVIGT